MIMINSKGEEVKKIQKVLNDFGLNVGKVDGVFGSATLKAVKDLQETFGLLVDGIIGDKTMSIINTLGRDVKHFKINEFRCKHCKKVRMSIDTLLKLEELRKRVGALIITSGYRCPTHNRNVGGAKNSKHVEGIAVDIKGVNASPKKVYDEAVKIFSNGGVGKYKTFTHVDTRGYKSRW